MGSFTASSPPLGSKARGPSVPYLFVVAMDGLHHILQKNANSPSFKFHLHYTRDTIEAFLGSTKRLFQYVPWSSINNQAAHIPQLQALIDRILTKIRLWTTAFLSYAGRLQLIKSVLFSYQVYWSTMFILPCSIVKRIESILSAFLWKGCSLLTTGAKVSWSALCFPQKEGGLGLKSIKSWNKAATLKHTWNLLTNSHSIWAQWMHSHRLKNNCFWQIKTPSKPSWSWRKILQSRDWSRGLFRKIIGNGSSTYLWMDYWLPGGFCISDSISARVIYATGIGWKAKVSAIISGGCWSFPSHDPAVQHIWDSIHSPPLPDQEDSYLWAGHPTGIFTIASAWEILRNKNPISPIYHLLWYPDHIPRQSFILWLASKNRLRTQDRLPQHSDGSNGTCSLCNSQIETHDHLFFDCTYSRLVWEQDLLTWASQKWTSKIQFSHLLAKLALSSTCYFLWQERNKRFFQQAHRPHNAIATDIIQQIRRQRDVRERRSAPNPSSRRKHIPLHEKPQGSWAERVRISDSSTRYTLDQLPRNIEGKTLKISEEITLANVEKWSRLPYQTVNTIASRVWRQCGLEHVMATSNGFTIFRFKTTDEMHAVMAKGPWMTTIPTLDQTGSEFGCYNGGPSASPVNEQTFMDEKD
uniref:Reverse transcriptase zinc-binding domain-containing protein n=1 Tax=Salix viminalis TaxID=40686 RepID=A0A6N2KQ62_SALVM